MADSIVSTDTFPRQYARTRRFSLGEPKGFRIAPDGNRIAFLRSHHGNEPVNCLWVAERTAQPTDGESTWTERLVCDPATLFGGGVTDSDLPAAERARRERLREQANGITGFDVDAQCVHATFTLGGHVLVTNLLDGDTIVLDTAPGAFDPHLSPDGRNVAYVSNRCLRIKAVTRLSDDRLLAGDHVEDIHWGVADFNAAEEFNRYRGFWWSPDSTKLVAARVDDSPVRPWYIADPANPSREPSVHRYPAAGTANAVVSLAIVSAETGQRIDIENDHAQFPYLISVSWTDTGIVAVWLNRAQTLQRTVEISPDAGLVRVLIDQSDPTWVELTPGTPHVDSSGRILTTVLSDDPPHGTTTLAHLHPDGTQVRRTPPGMQVQRVLHATDTRALLVANTVDGGPSNTAIVEVSFDADRTPDVTIIAGGENDRGMHDASAARTDAGDIVVVRSASVDRLRSQLRLFRNGVLEHEFANGAEEALAAPKPQFFFASERRLPACVLLPSENSPFAQTEQLPVLLDPYAGPHAQRVVNSRNAHASSQWFADQGFAVVVIDGRGTPGLGPAFERAVHGNLADPVLEDQVAGLLDAASRFPQLDLSRVGIRGWSFGGYLAALAVLKRPDVFHAAVAGAPVTEWRLYDTGYTERYLGDPTQDSGPYEVSSLLPLAKNLRRPLMLIHGLADDNVVAAHTLRLSSELLAHGRPHEVLPLSGVTHMTPQEAVAENLLRLQVDFLHRSLAAPERL